MVTLWNRRVGLSSSARAPVSNPDRPPSGTGRGALSKEGPCWNLSTRARGCQRLPKGLPGALWRPTHLSGALKGIQEPPLWARVLGRPAVSCTHAKQRLLICSRCSALGQLQGEQRPSELRPQHSLHSGPCSGVGTWAKPTPVPAGEAGVAPAQTEDPRLPFSHQDWVPGRPSRWGRKPFWAPVSGTGETKSHPPREGGSLPAA